MDLEEATGQGAGGGSVIERPCSRKRHRFDDRMYVSESTLSFWARGPSATEAEKCENAERVVRGALAADPTLSRLDISVFAQGSYRARTNVRADSDVDICVRFNETFFCDYPPGESDATCGNTTPSLYYHEFKNYVHQALVARFGQRGVTRGNKAFDVHANTYRIDADVVPVFGYRRYFPRSHPLLPVNYEEGVAFLPDTGSRVINYPFQNYQNGVARNTATGRAYKRMIRILKRLRAVMQERSIQEANGIPSFLIECLVWNAPIWVFQFNTYRETLKALLRQLWYLTRAEQDCSDWREVNGWKFLFHSAQPWTQASANRFLWAAFEFLDFL